MRKRARGTANSPIPNNDAPLFAMAVMRRYYRGYGGKYREAYYRSFVTLGRFLTPKQRQDVLILGYFVTRGSEGNFYKIGIWNISGNVRCLHPSSSFYYCAFPPGLPPGDVFLAQKLSLELNEKAFIRTATAYGLNRPRDFRVALREEGIAV